jgi:hypothetical protein
MERSAMIAVELLFDVAIFASLFPVMIARKKQKKS